MKTRSKKNEKEIKRDLAEINISRIREKNAEFLNLKRIFIQKSRKLKELSVIKGIEVEREL